MSEYVSLYGCPTVRKIEFSAFLAVLHARKLAGLYINV